MTQTILVTGATGTVGSAVVEYLTESEAHVRVATRETNAAERELGDGDDYVTFDFAHPETWGNALEDINRLFLVRPPVVSVTPIREFVDAAARIGVEQIVYLSVLGAEKNPLLPHRRIERHIKATNIPHTFLRASFFMQNLSEVHRPEIVEHDEVVVPAGTGKTSFVDARDIAAVAAVALTEEGHENRAYDVTGPEALNYDEVARIFSDILDRPITYTDPSILEFVRRMRARDQPLPFVVVMLGIYTTVRFGFSARATGDVDAILGRRPITMRQFVADYASTFQQ